MEYSIPVVYEEGKNYFLVCNKNMRFLFRRLNASSMIAVPENTIMDRFEVQRKGEIIIAGECYYLCGKMPIFLIGYSENQSYSPLRNTSMPHETLFAEDFDPGDMIFSTVNAAYVKAQGFASTISFFNKLDANLRSLQNGLYQGNIEMIISSGQSLIIRTENDQDVLGLKTFIIPESF
jgi:hypothetical protein